MVAPGRFLVLQTAQGSRVRRVVRSRVGRDRGRRRQGHPPPAATLAHARRDRQGRDEGDVCATSRTGSPGRRATGSTSPTRRRLALEQHAVIRNELAKLDGAEIRLISGYPSVQFAHVRSLLSPRTNLAAFFQELASNGRWQEIDGTGNSLVTQNASFNYRSPVCRHTRRDSDRRRRGFALSADRQADTRGGRSRSRSPSRRARPNTIGSWNG